MSLLRLLGCILIREERNHDWVYLDNKKHRRCTICGRVETVELVKCWHCADGWVEESLCNCGGIGAEIGCDCTRMAVRQCPACDGKGERAIWVKWRPA